MSLGQSKRWTRLFLYIASFPVDFFWGWPAVLFVRLFWGDSLKWEDGVLRCRVRDDSWLGKKFGARWAGSTLAPHAIIYFGMKLWPEELEEPNTTQRHEHVHVEQGEAAQLAAFVEALILVLVVSWMSWEMGVTLAVLTWISGTIRKIGSGYLTAILRGESGSGDYAGGYIGSHDEEAARALEHPENDRHAR